MDLLGDDVVEVFEGALGIGINIASVEYILELLLSQVVSNLLRNGFKVLNGNEIGAVGIEKLEDSSQLTPGGVLTDLGGHDVQEFLEIDQSRS